MSPRTSSCASLLSLYLLVFSAVHASEPNFAPGRANQECVLVDPSNAVCYLAEEKKIYQLQAFGDSISSRVVFDLAQHELTEDKAAEKKAWEFTVSSFAATVSGGDIVVAWLLEARHQFSINVLYLHSTGKTTHYIVKRFPQWDAAFDLRVASLDQRQLLFFYTNYSEQYFSPVRDKGSIRKLWALRWENRTVTYDEQISERGKAQTISYDMATGPEGVFHLAWVEEKGPDLPPIVRIGEFFPSREPPYKEVTRVGLDQKSRDILVFPLIAPLLHEERFGVVLEIYSYQKSTSNYKIISKTGTLLHEVKVSNNVTELSYDRKTGLFRYIDGELYDSGGATKSTTVDIHWTDFLKRKCTRQLELPDNVVHLRQPGGNCFYWLLIDKKRINLNRECRPASCS